MEKAAPENAQLGIHEWNEPLAKVPLSNVNKELSDLPIDVMVKLSLREALLTMRTECRGLLAKKYSKECIRTVFIDSPDNKLKDAEIFVNKLLKKGQSFKFKPEREWRAGVSKQIEDWFDSTLVGENAKKIGLVMPGHETLRKSFTLFLQKTGKKDFDRFKNECFNVSTEDEWNRSFLVPVEGWFQWFWPEFEKQWHETVGLFRGAIDEQHTLYIKAISSLAYDVNNKEYVVPLVIGDALLQADQPEKETGDNPLPAVEDAPLPVDGNIGPKAESQEKSSVGIE
jgi:hypothetical protein